MAAWDAGGEGEPLLVLLHGLGATRQVFRPMLEQACWKGRWLAIDLPGHGGSPPSCDYSPEAQAAWVGREIAARQGGGELVVLGHSLGGVVALALASGRFGVRPARVFGLGVKAVWTAEELAAMAARAERPAKTFATQEEAIGQHLKVSGLQGLVPPRSAMACSGVRPEGGEWRLAMDPRANGLGAPPMRRLVRAARAPVHLACGENDPLSNAVDLRRFDPDARTLPGLGHNAMVEDPRAVWDWLTQVNVGEDEAAN
jgi:pimeloyl-ACP methyl ester carboxylesterase